ncbi:hypothetical protein [Lewinella sp. W8]|uniref:hypothetical protein n=1 Tax=Lewinella sp. W8 TaxID=2528208 RepID=UPI001068363A|nr:hypothetical protein [Lewinella sp. W8]MTB50471.1 hypothetical protein [Lewinella sp. W8]
MNFFLQVNELSVDVWWLLGVAVLAVIFYFTLRYFQQRQQRRRAERHDPKAAIVNDTNYNIDRAGMDNHRADTTSPEEAQRAVETLDATDQIPTEEEFGDLRRTLKKS